VRVQAEHRSARAVSETGTTDFPGATICVQKVMRDQYARDISDLLKLALLRALVDESETLGVGWYYNPVNDGRPDGRQGRNFIALLSHQLRDVVRGRWT